MTTAVEVADCFTRIKGVLSDYAGVYGRNIQRLATIEIGRLEYYADNILMFDKFPLETFAKSIEYSKDSISHMKPVATYAETVAWERMWNEIERPVQEPEITNADIGKARTRMNIVFSRYEGAWEGRISDMVSQANEYMNEIMNCVLTGIIPVEALPGHVENAKQVIYRLNPEPTEPEMDIWNGMWDEVG
jgi:hypothetical protein